MISGIGVDLVEIARMERILQRWGDRFLQKVFTAEEIAYCRAKAVPALHYAARFAAKEASLKAMGLGLGMGLALKDIGTAHRGGGAPELSFSEAGQRALYRAEIRRAHLSLTHTKEFAIAMVVMEK